jgi:hypothetical protein
MYIFIFFTKIKNLVKKNNLQTELENLELNSQNMPGFSEKDFGILFYKEGNQIINKINKIEYKHLIELENIHNFISINDKI